MYPNEEYPVVLRRDGMVLSREIKPNHALPIGPDHAKVRELETGEIGIVDWDATMLANLRLKHRVIEMEGKCSRCGGRPPEGVLQPPEGEVAEHQNRYCRPCYGAKVDLGHLKSRDETEPYEQSHWQKRIAALETRVMNLLPQYADVPKP